MDRFTVSIAQKVAFSLDTSPSAKGVPPQSMIVSNRDQYEKSTNSIRSRSEDRRKDRSLSPKTKDRTSERTDHFLQKQRTEQITLAIFKDRTNYRLCGWEEHALWLRKRREHFAIERHGGLCGENGCSAEKGSRGQDPLRGMGSAPDLRGMGGEVGVLGSKATEKQEIGRLFVVLPRIERYHLSGFERAASQIVADRVLLYDLPP